jgi:CDP-glycerol glycerophosphotransferase
MHGNITPLMEMVREKAPDVQQYFLAFPEYLKLYAGKQPLPTLNMLNLFDMIKVAQSDVVITNYIPLTLVFYARFTGIKFVDVWHGLPLLKNQTPKIMNYQNYYAEIWLSSPAMQKFYRERYQLRSKLVVTGYGRVDRLVNGEYDASAIKAKHDIPLDKKILLIAPTWKHNNPDRRQLPFGLSTEEFFARLDDLAKRTNSFIIFRAHMLGDSTQAAAAAENIKQMPSQDYPDGEELLAISDMVVTDWSSIVFDFLPLHRPVIFIDGETPFVGAELEARSSPQNRFGAIVKTFDEFDTAVTKYLANPDSFQTDYAGQIKKISELAYGDTLDGKATERYYEHLAGLLGYE